MDIAAVNGLPAETFVERFGDVAEASPWVAAGAAAKRPFADREAIIAAFAAAIDNADAGHRLALLRAHPDLAGRAAIAGDVAADSKEEQASAGLDRLTAAEFARFTELNARYRERFGFPFILAVRNATRDAVLSSFAARIDNDPAEEFATALAEVKRIIRFRIETRITG